MTEVYVIGPSEDHEALVGLLGELIDDGSGGDSVFEIRFPIAWSEGPLFDSREWFDGRLLSAGAALESVSMMLKGSLLSFSLYNSRLRIYTLEDHISIRVLDGTVPKSFLASPLVGPSSDLFDEDSLVCRHEVVGPVFWERAYRLLEKSSPCVVSLVWAEGVCGGLRYLVRTRQDLDALRESIPPRSHVEILNGKNVYTGVSRSGLDEFFAGHPDKPLYHVFDWRKPSMRLIERTENHFAEDAKESFESAEGATVTVFDSLWPDGNYLIGAVADADGVVRAYENQSYEDDESDL